MYQKMGGHCCAEKTKPWLQRYPFRRRPLASVKLGIYRPDLPRLRLYSLDDERASVSADHCRHSTLLTRARFDEGVASLVRDRTLRLDDEDFEKVVPTFDVSDWKDWIGERKPAWEDFVQSKGRVTVLKMNDGGMHFANQFVQYTLPDDLLWKRSVQCGPRDRCQPKPRPATPSPCHRRHQPPTICRWGRWRQLPCVVPWKNTHWSP